MGKCLCRLLGGGLLAAAAIAGAFPPPGDPPIGGPPDSKNTWYVPNPSISISANATFEPDARMSRTGYVTGTYANVKLEFVANMCPTNGILNPKGVESKPEPVTAVLLEKFDLQIGGKTIHGTPVAQTPNGSITGPITIWSQNLGSKPYSCKLRYASTHFKNGAIQAILTPHFILLREGSPAGATTKPYFSTDAVEVTVWNKAICYATEETQVKAPKRDANGQILRDSRGNIIPQVICLGKDTRPEQTNPRDESQEKAIECKEAKAAANKAREYLPKDELNHAFLAPETYGDSHAYGHARTTANTLQTSFRRC
jgi:hypothetical protein